MHGPRAAGAGGFFACPGQANRPGTPGRFKPEHPGVSVGVEVAFGFGVLAGAAASKTLSKVKEKIKRRFIKEVKSALEEDEQSQ